MTPDSPSDRDEHSTAIVKFEGRPNEPNRPSEPTRWQRFKAVLWPWCRETTQRAQYLADAFAEAEVAKRRSEAAKLAAEAANIAAKTDRERQETMKSVNEEIDRIFASDAAQDVKHLQLATLAAANPQIAVQLQRIVELLERLRVERGVRVEVLDPQMQALPNAGQTAGDG